MRRRRASKWTTFGLLLSTAFVAMAGILWLPGAEAAAQEAGQKAAVLSGVSLEPVPYDLDRIVRRALSHHLGVRVSRLQQAVAEHEATGSQAALKPSLSVTVRPNWFETPGPPDFEALELDLDADRIRDLLDRIDDWDACLDDVGNCEPLKQLLDEFEDQIRDLSKQLGSQELKQGRSHGVTLNGAVPLWRSPLQRAIADAARWQTVRANVDADEASAGAILQSIDAYFAVLRAEADVEIAELTLAEAELQLREVESRVRSGTATNIDRLQVEAERYGAEAQLLQAQGEAAAARMMLNAILGFERDTPLLLASPEPPTPEQNAALGWAAADGTPDVDGALRGAAQSSEVRQAFVDWQLAGAGAIIAEEQAKPELRVFGSGKWPELELTLGVDRHGYLGGSLEWNQTYLEGKRLEEDEPASWFAGFEMTWTLFDGGKQRAEVEAAKLQAEQAALYYEHVEQTARTEVLAAYVRWQAAEEAMHGVAQGVAAAAEGVDVARQLAEAGAATEAAVLQAEIGLARAKQGWLDALYGATIAHSAYLHAAGELVPYWEARLSLGL